MKNNLNISLTIKPTWFLSSSYAFFDRDTNQIGSITLPLLARIFGSNSATLTFENIDYQLIDSAIALNVNTQSRYVNTLLKKDNLVVIELQYKSLKSSEEYRIIEQDKKLEYLIKLNGFGVWDIFLNNQKIGNLTNKEFIMRRASLELSEPVPALVQMLIFWGSINNQG